MRPVWTGIPMFRPQQVIVIILITSRRIRIRAPEPSGGCFEEGRSKELNTEIGEEAKNPFRSQCNIQKKTLPPHRWTAIGRSVGGKGAGVEGAERKGFCHRCRHR